MMHPLSLPPVDKSLILTEDAGQHQQHQAEPQQQQQDERSGQLGGPGQLGGSAAGARRSGLQVALHTVHQVVGLGTVAQLSPGLVDLKGVANGDAPHLEGEERGQKSSRERARGHAV